jgi:hypothetical protein
MTLRERPVEETATLPDGRAVTVRAGLLPDPYIDSGDNDTVGIELSVDGEHAAYVNTVLDAVQDSEARALVREIVAGLEGGKLEPTASAIEPLADRLR